jgi:excisionase family DNA binding protein
MTEILSVGQASKKFGVHEQTIRVWVEQGKLNAFKTPSGQRRIIISKEATKAKEYPKEQYKAIYCRVSSGKQKDDLKRQTEFMQQRYKGYKVFQDIGSGINFKRKALLSLLDDTLNGLVEEVVVSSRDRLCRFAFELFEWIFERQGTKLTIINSVDNSPESELSDDVLSIIQVFCCRRNGKRRYTSKMLQDQTACNKESKCVTQEL